MGNPSNHKSPNIFINSHGGDLLLRGGFVHQIREALNSIEVNAYADEPTGESESLTQDVLEKIDKSRIAIVVFSSKYTESRWCLEELVKIKERMEQGKLSVIPIFYKLEGGSGLSLENPDFDHEKVKIWNEALDSVSCTMGYHLYKTSVESRFIPSIVKEVKRLLSQIPIEEQNNEPHEDNSSKPEMVDGESVEAELRGESIKDATFLREANEKVVEDVSTSSTLVTPPQHKVFINFRGIDLHDGFVGHIVEALEKVGFNVFIDEDESLPGELTELLFKRIEESRIAIVIFSNRYTESTWCLDKLVKIKECMDEGKLHIVPIFYKVKQLQVKQLEGNFGVRLWNLWRIHRGHQIIKCKEALEYVGGMRGFPFDKRRPENELITSIVKDINSMIKISLQGGKNPSLFPSSEGGESTQFPTGEGENHETYLNKHPFFGIELRMEQLERKLEFDNNETRIIGVVGMPGVGKTTLAMMLHEKWNRNFVRCMPLMGIRKMLNDHEPAWLRKTLLEVLLEGNFPVTDNETTHESVKDKLLQAKVFVILDDVTEKKQLDILLGNLDWIKKGSKIVITTCDKSLLEGFATDTYVVPLLNDKEAFQLFCYHAFDDKINSPTGTVLTLSRVYVDHARGHPLALILLGTELRGKDKAHWEHSLKTETHTYDTNIWRLSTDQLNEQQKDVFDIIYFFISGDEYFIRCLLGSGDSDAAEPVGVLKDLADKFLITVSGGRVEMNDLLYRFGKGLGSPWQSRLWNYNDNNSLKEIKTMEANNVRGILLDMSKVTKKIDLESTFFTNMDNLRYLKIFDSCCPRQCKTECKQHVPNGFKFPFKDVRYFHWVKFPLEELPPDFSPGALVDLRLPYSKIEHVWQGVKATPRLKWVDLRHSSKLLDLSALSKAENLQRLILEGCTNLKELPRKIQKMKSLVFLNLRGCIGLSSLPLMNLISLKTLILSDCTNLEEFQPISESLEVLHLDGTAIKGLPPAIKNLQRLVLLNLKNCKMLECLPNCLGELKALEELILSGCSRLENLSNVKESMKHLLSLLIDSIGAKEMPNISSVTVPGSQDSADMLLQPLGPGRWPCVVNGVSCLQRLCLSGNDFVSLQSDIWQLYDLKWLDVKDCKKLLSLPMLPPKLQYFDAHGCDSLESVATPLVLPVLTEHTSVRFNFSNCNKLDQDAKDSIISHTQWKNQFLMDTLFPYNGGFVFEALIGTCFPGWEVPAWFNHQVSGPLLETKLRPHLCDNRFTGIALCAVIMFQGYLDQSNRLLVTCNCVFKYEDGSCIRFSCTVCSWNEPSNTALKLESSHVFIGYTTMLDNKKHGGKDNEEGCTLTDASLEFQVTDSTEEVVGCRVLNCGFRLVFASDGREDTCWDTKRIENIPGESETLEKSTSHDDIQNESSYLTLGTNENFLTEVESGANLSLRKSLENKSVDALSVENEGGEITMSSDHDNTSSGNLEKPEMSYFVGVNLRLKQMEKVLYSTWGETRIVGIVGMHGIGKTTLAKILFVSRGSKFPSHSFLTMSKDCRPEQLRRMFLKELLKHTNQNISDETTHEFVKDELLQTKVFAVLDGVSDKNQLQFLLGNLDWIKKGSKIVITTCDKSLLEGLAHDTYVVPHLNNKEALQLFSYHAFKDQIYSPTGTFVSLSRILVDNAGGNPLSLTLLGSILCGKDEAYWEEELQRARQSFTTKMREVWTFYFDQLNERQKDVFLDIVYFFKSEDEYFIRSLMDSGNSETVSKVKDLADKLLITISGGKVEVHDQMYTLGKELDSHGWYRLLNDKDIIEYLTKEKHQDANNVRGIFLDMFEVEKDIVLDSMTFTILRNLRYLKIYDSCCPRQCKSNCKLHFPDGFELPLEEVRYLHWVKFPLEELPPDFKPENLVDLRLPYSKIERVWEGVKDTPRLKWVDLRHSSRLCNLSALSKAENLQRLNLEGCTVLTELPAEIQNMKSLVFLNMRGCIRLWSLPKMNLISLKTLILSGCTNLEEFQLISESVEFLHLDGTAIKGLPLAIQKLQRLVLFNLENCKRLEYLPNCLGELKSLEKLIVSGCSSLQNLSEVRESMKHLQSLLIERIGAKEMPNICEGQASADVVLQPFGPSRWPRGVNGASSSLRRLSLSGNDFVSLQTDIGKLYNLNWLDVKDCKMLRSIPMLPPRLQYFDAQGCDSLERVANPLAIQVFTHHIHATFKFSNCNKLDQDAKDSIISYTQWRSQLVLNALYRHSGASVMEPLTGTCYPGWEVPAWFSHQASGSLLKPNLPPHWSRNRFTGIALCAVIRFSDYHEHRSRVLVKCKCRFNNEDRSRFVSLSLAVGGWSDPGKTAGDTVPSHVFIGYANMLDIIRKHGEEEEDKEGCSHTKASFEFEVSDGTKVLNSCEVLKCGFNLVYASDELRVKSGLCGEANQYRAYSRKVEISSATSETETLGSRADGRHEIVELPDKVTAMTKTASIPSGGYSIFASTAVPKDLAVIAGRKLKSLGRGVMAVGRVLFLALFAALLFSLFIAPLLFTDAKSPASW